MTDEGLEPPISCSVGTRLIQCQPVTTTMLLCEKALINDALHQICTAAAHFEPFALHFMPCGNGMQNVGLTTLEAIDAEWQITNLQPHRLTEELLHCTRSTAGARVEPGCDKFVTTKSRNRQCKSCASVPQ